VLIFNCICVNIHYSAARYFWLLMSLIHERVRCYYLLVSYSLVCECVCTCRLGDLLCYSCTLYLSSILSVYAYV